MPNMLLIHLKYWASIIFCAVAATVSLLKGFPGIGMPSEIFAATLTIIALVLTALWFRRKAIAAREMLNGWLPEPPAQSR